MVTHRILYFDLVKLLAITLVCWGHSYYLVTLPAFSRILPWIGSFHMPLFMLLSGYFSYHSFLKQPRAYLTSRAKQLLIPAITIPLLTILTCWLIGSRSGDIYQIARNEMIGGMWFFKTLLAIDVYIYLAKRLLPWSDAAICELTVFIAIIFPHGYFLQFNWMLLFFWSGYFLRKYRDNYEPHRIIIGTIALILYIVLGRHEAPILMTYANMTNQPLVIVWQYLTGLAASIAVIEVTYQIAKACKSASHDAWLEKVGEVGKCTLAIYGLQSIVLQRIFLAYIHFDMTDYPLWVGDGLVVMAIAICSVWICYWLQRLLSRNKWSNLLLFGR